MTSKIETRAASQIVSTTYWRASRTCAAVWYRDEEEGDALVEREGGGEGADLPFVGRSCRSPPFGANALVMARVCSSTSAPTIA